MSSAKRRLLKVDPLFKYHHWVNRPCLIVITKDQPLHKEQVLKAFKRTINFTKVSYAPAGVPHLSNFKLRVEFDTAQQRDETLNRLKGASEISAELPKVLRPKFILKGVSRDTAAESLVETIKVQNPSVGETIKDEKCLKLHFTRKNRHKSRYNAVFMAVLAVWHTIMKIDRVNVDYERVYVPNYSPFLQCFRCLQFGHTRANCKSETSMCSHCAATDHTFEKCPSKSDNGLRKCHNCTQHNSKFNKKANTGHAATSDDCPRIKSLRQRINLKINFNG
ncbi:unnamed protein product [Chilo suppressalis]|uniref:CCHC-type domain-containing protein n=1 Tax=Chilo suppressalis TaxID=168631 RepID=A0ABN8ARV8_CHISP|nr:unnamed protein product [Chilo suppressalis]